MACQGTYLGGCCNEVVSPPRDLVVSATVQVRGFIPVDHVDRQQVYREATANGTVSWTDGFTNYRGSYSKLSVMGPNGPVSTFEQTGVGIGPPFSLMRFVVNGPGSISITHHIGSINCSGTVWAREEIGVSGPLTKAHELVLEKVGGYNPFTGENPGGAQVASAAGGGAGLDIGTFAPSRGDFPPRAALEVCQSAGYAGNHIFESRVTAAAVRCIFAARPGFQLRLRPYFRSEFQTGPIVYESCSVASLESGADVMVTNVPGGMQQAFVELTIHPLNGPPPC